MVAGNARRATMPLLILAIGLVSFVTLRDGYSWYWDDAGYVLNARNLARGLPYAETDYLPNPYNYIAPRDYPPGLPLLLAPVIAVFGVDPTALRILNVVFLMGALLGLARLTRNALPLPYRCVLVGAVGLHPMFWDYLHRTMSDLPFVCFVLLALMAYGDAHDPGATPRKRVLKGVLAGAITYYAIITRPIGLTLPASFLVYELLRHRRPTRVLVALAATCAVLFAGHQVVKTGYERHARESMEESAMHRPLTAPEVRRAREGGTTGVSETAARHGYAYLAVYNILRDAERVPGRVARNLVRYSRFADLLWGNLYNRALQHLVFAGLLILAVAGFVSRARHRLSAVEVFAVVYFLSLLPWSWGGPRFMFPLIPLFLLHAVEGARWIGSLTGRPAVLLVAVAVAVGGTYLAKHSRTTRAPIVDFWTGPKAEPLHRFLAEETDREDVFIGHFPRQLALFGNRAFSAPPRATRTPDERWWEYFGLLGVRYVVVGPNLPPPVRPMELIVELQAFIDRWPDRFEVALDSPFYRVYRIVGESVDPEPSGGPAPG